MKLLLALFLVAAAFFVSEAAPLSSASHTAKSKRRPASRGDAIQRAKSKRGKKSNLRRITVRRMVHGRWVKVSRLVRSGPVVPPHPEAERLREIQQALSAKGFFHGPVNGTWNADSVAALKAFQTSRGMTPDGKINSLSLIGLGLGPKHDASLAVSQPAPPNMPPQ